MVLSANNLTVDEKPTAFIFVIYIEQEETQS